MSAERISRVLLPALSLLLLAGCGTSSSTHSPKLAATDGIRGQVHGGQQPVALSTIQLYAVGTSGDGSASTPLIAQTVLTDVNGNFNITGDYSCTNATDVYITAMGGNAGVGNNPNLALMTALGPCSALTSGTVISINELTTVAATSALAPFMTALNAVGSGTSDASALASAFALSSEFVDPSIGLSPGQNVPAGYLVSTAEINTLGDITAACVNSVGGTAGDGSECGQLFSLTTPPTTAAPTNTIAALLDLANNPTLNTAALYNLASASAPFQPGLTEAPANFQVALTPMAGSEVLTVSSTAISFPASILNYPSTAQTVTLNNVGSTTVTLGSITISGTNAADFVQTNNCSNTLLAGRICTVQVTATPQALGLRTAILNVPSGDAAAPQTVALSVNGVAATAGPVSLSASKLSYTLAGTLQDVTITNSGTSPLLISSYVYQDTNSPYLTTNNFSVYANSCGNNLAAQSSCTLTFESLDMGFNSNTFSLDTFTGTLEIVDNAAAGPQTISLTSTNGGEVESRGIQFQPNAVGVAESGSITGLGVNYEEGLPYINLTLGGADPGDFAVTGNTCTGGGGTSCLVSFTFTPTAAGPRTAKALVNGTSQYLYLSGTGIASGPSFLLTQTSIALFSYFPTYPDPYAGANATSALTVVNTGTTTLDLTASAVGVDPAQTSFNMGTCSSSVAAGGTCTATVTFTPSAANQAMSGNVTITDSLSGFMHTTPLAETAQFWPVGVTPLTLSFGDQSPGTTSSAQSVVISDQDGYPLGHPVTLSLPASSNFVLPEGSTCPASLIRTCTLSVAFSPKTTGPISETATVDDLTSGNYTSFSLTGQGGTPAVFLSKNAVTFSNQAVGTSAQSTVNVTNTGTAPLSITSIGVVGAVNGNFTQTNNCSSLAPNVSCVITLTFAPKISGGQSATVQILSNAASSPDSIGLSGTSN